MMEILSAEQPCVLCGGLLEVVTWHRDPDTGAERIDRERLTHSDAECSYMLNLYPETWPVAARNGA